jgi:hypothetical protein
VLRLCQYFGAKEECGFCDINHNWRQHKKEGRPYTGVKAVEDVLEALAIIEQYDTEGEQAYTLTGGRHVDRRRACGGRLRPLRAGDRAPSAGSAKLSRRRFLARTSSAKDYSITIYHPNYEVWDKRLSDHLARQERYVGREEWHSADLRRGGSARSALRDPELRRGVEMAAPFGFRTVDEAIASTTGARLLHEPRGLRASTWCPERDAARPRQPRRAP